MRSGTGVRPGHLCGCLARDDWAAPDLHSCLFSLCFLLLDSFMKPYSTWARGLLLPGALVLGLSACSRQEAKPEAGTPVPWVRTVALESADSGQLVLSGTVRARHEAPVAFQIGGRVLARQVEAGQGVKAGQLLFSLDPRDVAATEQAVAAQLAAAEAALATAQRELERQRQLVAQGFVSVQTLDRFELAQRDALSRLDVVRSASAQARNARGYTELRAARAGVITEVMVEAGQVVSPGQGLATLAQAGEREIEVHLPSAPSASQQGRVEGADGQSQAVQLREVAGAADPVSRTWRARYRLDAGHQPEAWPLGSVVRLVLGQPGTAQSSQAQQVPLGALDERADGPRLWRVVNGKVESVSVKVIELGASHARIQSPLAVGDKVVALGTHRLSPGLAVRELAP